MTQTTLEPRISPSTLAAEIGVHEATLRGWIRRGILPAWRTPGGRLLIARRDVEALIASGSTSSAHLSESLSA